MDHLARALNCSTDQRAATPSTLSRPVIWLQAATLAWLSVECGLSLWAAWHAHSPVLLAFGADSLVESLSAAVVMLCFSSSFSVSEHAASRMAAVLLYTLAAAVVCISAISLALHRGSEPSRLGIAVSILALVVMPILGGFKRRLARFLGSNALRADAAQSFTCAYLAGITLTGLAVGAYFHIGWFDSTAALLAVPLLVKEGREAWQGNVCNC